MDRKWFLKALIIGFIIIAAAMLAASEGWAQILTSQIMCQNGYAVALDRTGTRIDPNDTANIDTVLVDNFECWNNNWYNRNNIPPYPIWGYGLVYGQVNIVLDFEQGSLVLDVYRPMSVFLMNTGYDVYQIYWQTVLTNNKPTPGTCSVMSLEVRAPLAIEYLDTFSITVSTKVTASDGTTGVDFSIEFRPIEGPMGYIGLMGALEDDQCIDEDNDGATVALGRQFQDGGWYQVMEDLAEIISQFDAGPDGDVGTSDDATLESINRIMIRGNQYRLDNIMFSIPSRSIAANDAVHLIHIGPVYCQLYGQQGDIPQGRWIYAENLDLGLTSECTADDGYLFPRIADDADGDGIPTALHINPDGTIENQADITESTLAIYHLDPNGKPNLASPQTPADADLTWVLTMGDTLGPVITDGFIEAAEINLDGDDTISGDEMNTWPPYLIQRNGVFILNKVETDPDLVQATGTPYVMNLTNPMYALACALLNSGYEVFPNARRIVPHLGQVFEDMIVTCQVSDGMATDKETFPISVVNYPVTNNPPIIMNVEDQTFEVGKTNYYQILAYDPDLEDMLEGLSYNATLHGESTYYQFGPWWPPPNRLPNGLITLKPFCEGTIDCIVTVTDPRGMNAMCQFTIFCKIIDEYPGNWFNHPPVILGELDSPQTIRAGEKFIASEMDFFDPDGDKMYWSCNVGSVGNNGVYTFQSIYPGNYQVQIIAYDIRGGATSTEFVIHVKPWWSL